MAKRRFTRITTGHPRPKRNTHYKNKSRHTRSTRNLTIKQDELSTCLKFIKNLSTHTLSNPEILLLGKGLGFIPTPPKPKRYSLLQAINQLTRTMRIKYFMHDKSSKPYHKFRLPSTWKPRVTPCTALEDYLFNTKALLAKIPIHPAESNISNLERSAIRSLRSDKTIVIKKFDKGRGVAIINKSDYKKEALRQLSGPQYQQLTSDITMETTAMVKTLVSNHFHKEEISEDIFDYLNPSNHDIRTPLFYMLPKVHKQPPEGSVFIGRPIISGCGGPTQQISEFLDFFLLPLVQRQPTYVKDTNHILDLIDNLKLPNNILLVTLDVVGMYTNIPQNEAIKACTDAYKASNGALYSLPKISTESLQQILELIIKRNCFKFDTSYYLQTVGVAMGSESSPEIADITFHHFENEIIPLSKRIIRWLRYRDDILLFFDGSEFELKTFVDHINTLHPTLKFTYESSYSEVNYLDINIFKGDRFAETNFLDTRTYSKPSETFQYLSRNSTHPESCFKGFIKGETLRHLRLCNNRQDFYEKVNSFKENLIRRNYSDNYVSNIVSEINFEERISHLSPKPKDSSPPLVFKFMYSPHIKTKDLKRCLLKHWHYITEHPTLKNLFPKPPLIAYKRATNLSDSLIRANFISETESNLQFNKFDLSLVNIMSDLLSE